MADKKFQAVANDASIYEVIDAKKIDSQREQYCQPNNATTNKEGLYATSRRPQKEGTNSKVTVCIFITIAVVAIVLLICIAVLFVEVVELKRTATSQQSSLEQQTPNDSSILLQMQQMKNEFKDELRNELYHQVSAMLDGNTDQLNRMFEMRFMELSQSISLLQNKTDFIITGQFETLPVTSCTALPPSSPSGYYWVRASNGSAVRVYCDMTLSCGNITGGWMRVGELDFNNTSIMCPSSLSPLQEMNTRTCRIASSDAGCASVLFSTSGVTYNQVCGKVLAYQVNTPDAFGAVTTARMSTIDGNYVDGVSLTYGTGPRKHIWTFAAALDEYGGGIFNRTICQCSTKTYTERQSPAFVGQDYFCDSGIARQHQNDFPGLLTTSPLWDGAGCGSNSTCCTFNNPPWFHKQLPSPTSEDIEMRVCRDQGRGDEDIASVEIYIR